MNANAKILPLVIALFVLSAHALSANDRQEEERRRATAEGSTTGSTTTQRGITSTSESTKRVIQGAESSTRHRSRRHSPPARQSAGDIQPTIGQSCSAAAADERAPKSARPHARARILQQRTCPLYETYGPDPVRPRAQAYPDQDAYRAGNVLLPAKRLLRHLRVGDSAIRIHDVPPVWAVGRRVPSIRTSPCRRRTICNDVLQPLGRPGDTTVGAGHTPPCRG
jgi:hypothetical protein